MFTGPRAFSETVVLTTVEDRLRWTFPSRSDDSCPMTGLTVNTMKKEKEKPVAAKKRQVCSVDGCQNLSQIRGFCDKHGGKPCAVEGCATKACRGGKVCRKHSTDKVTCSAEGCGNIAKARGLCKTHAGHKKVCSTDGCGTATVCRGLCMKHGAYGFCSFGECTTAATSVAKGRCRRHSSGSTKVCKITGCTTLVYARDVCVEHGAKGTCQFDGCTSSPRHGSQHCLKHGGKTNRPCSVPGCTTFFVHKGLCTKHGGGAGECWIDGCTNQMVSRLKTCGTHGGKGYCSLQPKCYGVSSGSYSDTETPASFTMGSSSNALYGASVQDRANGFAQMVPPAFSVCSSDGTFSSGSSDRDIISSGSSDSSDRMPSSREWSTSPIMGSSSYYLPATVPRNVSTLQVPVTHQRKIPKLGETVYATSTTVTLEKLKDAKFCVSLRTKDIKAGFAGTYTFAEWALILSAKGRNRFAEVLELSAEDRELLTKEAKRYKHNRWQSNYRIRKQPGKRADGIDTTQ